VEDQPTDSGDLSADAAAASVPQGKATHRHRLPRQKHRDIGEVDEGAGDDVSADPVVSESEPVSTAVESDSPPDSTPESGEPVVEPKPEEPKRRSRFPWRRAETSEPSDPPSADTDTDAGDGDRDGEDAGTEGGGTDTVEPEPEPILVPHQPAGRRLKAVAVAAGVLFIAAAGFAGAALQPYLADRAVAHTKFEIARTAADAITTLWTYTPDDMETLPQRSAKYLGGDFATDYKRYIDAIAAPNKQAQVTNNTEVLGAAVESLTPDEATAIVYTNSVATSPVTKGIPSLRYLSYRLTMKRDAREWLITQMVAVTKLDLTPRL
jgi:Mce-associated membrane protein